ncbi:MAG: histidine kinase, partial [Gammaproteobacteria bacterium]|nr:histidine kinase [Gammaproteobacteria bacterium]
LIAIVLAIASASAAGSLTIHLALMSLYIQWTGLTSAGLLCWLGRSGVLDSTFKATLLSVLVVFMLSATMAALAYQINDLLRLDLFRQQSLLLVITQHVSVSLILYGLALRYFYVQYAAKAMIKAESHARLQALQARIRPHFLFNSLNTIASLTYDEPEKAEHAIVSLADLFRASLRSETQISLSDEIELTREYINLESLRLGERLQVNWDVQADTDAWTLPALTLQPLVENAIYHGIEPLQHGGEINIVIQQTAVLQIQISNPILQKSTTQHRQGNQMALENIRERLSLSFQGRAKISHLVENGLYKVEIKIPVIIN